MKNPAISCPKNTDPEKNMYVLKSTEQFLPSKTFTYDKNWHIQVILCDGYEIE